MKQYLIKWMAVLLVCLTFTAISAPKKQLWSRWTAHDSASTRTIDYADWQDFLGSYVFAGVRGINLVAYSKVTPEDKQKLERTIHTLEAIPISKYNRNEQLAYWINLYNALTVSVVLNHYPVKSIRDIHLSSKLFGKGPWDAKLLKIEGMSVSLNDIEHRILRPIWHDARIHYALNCASISCPNLMKVPYTSKNAQPLMNQNASDYINSPRGVFINSKKQLIVSSIYKWYQADFGGSDAGVIAHLKKYAKAPLLKVLKGRHHVDGYEYNWSLNEGAR